MARRFTVNDLRDFIGHHPTNAQRTYHDVPETWGVTNIWKRSQPIVGRQ